jgi:predicted small secreted protein
MKITFAALTFLLAAAAAACNTVEGLGKDTQAAGAAVEDASKDAQH